MYKNGTLFNKLKNSLVNTRKKFAESLFGLFYGVKKIDDSLLNQLEERLLISDVGVCTTKKIIDTLINRCSGDRGSNNSVCNIYQILREEMLKILSFIDHTLIVRDKKPFVILIVGVNGVGKTSVIVKLSYRYCLEGKKVLIGAADTFRAAAVEQLQVLSAQNNIPVVVPSSFSADPASVVFDSLRRAKSEMMDILIIDTAGRLHNKSHLMSELQKIVRVIKKFDVDAPDEVMLVLDASIGQNSINQVALFNEYVGVTGIAISKLDGTSKGGVLFSVVDQFGIPIRYVSFGKRVIDLDVFHAKSFVESIFD